MKAKVVQWLFGPLLFLLLFLQVLHLHVRRQRGAGVLPAFTQALQDRKIHHWRKAASLPAISVLMYQVRSTFRSEGEVTHLESVLIFDKGIGHRGRGRQHEPEVDSQAALPVQLRADVHH